MSKRLSIRIENKLQRLLANTGDMALKRRAKRIIEELNPQNGEKILDVGCGDGYYLYLLSNLGIKLSLTGVDFDKRALESARKNLRLKKVKLLSADLMKGLPFEDSSFDKAVMSEVCEHLPDDIKGLKEVRRVLKPDGVLCITVPNANYPFLWDPINWTLEHIFGTHIRSGFWAGIWNQHVRLFKPEQIKKVLQKAGFGVEKQETLTFWSVPFNHQLVNLGARVLALKRRSSIITKGANKFLKGKDKSLPVKFFFVIGNLIDGMNNLRFPRSSSVSVFVKAKKRD